MSALCTAPSRQPMNNAEGRLPRCYRRKDGIQLAIIRASAKSLGAKPSGRRVIAAVLAVIGASLMGIGDAAAAVPDYPTVALRVADALLARQDAAGAIPDEPGGSAVNEDSNMEYGLVGLAAAYWHS